MIGKILAIKDSIVEIELNFDLNRAKSLINVFIIFEEAESQIIGEIQDVFKKGDKSYAYASFVGEFSDDRFKFGTSVNPSFAATVRFAKKSEVKLILGSNLYDKRKQLELGTSPIFGLPIYLRVNDFLSNHFAIFGNTGSGKSNAVARILQNVFSKTEGVPYNANIFIFDAYGEYHQAFSELSKINPELNFKSYTTADTTDTDRLIKIPVWLLDVDDWALLLGVDRHIQLPILEKALNLVKVFKLGSKEANDLKNHILAKAIMTILTNSGSSSTARDRVFSVLVNFNTEEINLEAKIVQPGVIRTLKQCFLIDEHGKLREMELITKFFSQFIKEEFDLNYVDKLVKYDLQDFKKALDFAIISEGELSSDSVYDYTNVLKVRLDSIINGSYNDYFGETEYNSLEEYIKSLVLIEGEKKAQIINFNIHGVDDRFAKVITKIYSKMFFNYTKSLKDRTSFPIHIILEEAHRYAQKDTDIEILGYNIFERISKEGRKYGIILGLVSQRPSEVSETIVSQCSNVILFRINHPRDLAYMREMVPNITTAILDKLTYLQVGTCIAFGTAVNLPVMVNIERPVPDPYSSSADIANVWYQNKIIGG